MKPPAYLLANLLSVFVQTLPQLVGVGVDAAADVVAVLLHHGLELTQVVSATLLGIQHVPLESVDQKLQVLRH